MKLKDIPTIERPREKLEKYGPEKLSDSELLAILLRTGAHGVNAVELAGRIVRRLGARGMADARVPELKDVFGLGSAKACEIVACFELGRRVLRDKKTRVYLTPEDVWQELKDIRDHKKEHFVVFFLDARNQELKRITVSVGTLTANLVHPREVFEAAIAVSAASIIVAHNHPSGITEPSSEDIVITRRLSHAGQILGIELADHVIVAKAGCMSMRACGLLN